MDAASASEGAGGPSALLVDALAVAAEQGRALTRVLVATVRHASLPVQCADAQLQAKVFFGRCSQAGLSSWPLAAEARSAAVTLMDEKSKCHAHFGASATFPWHGAVDRVLRVRITEPPLHSALADILLEVPLDGDVSGSVRREVPLPFKGYDGRWSVGSLVVDLELREMPRSMVEDVFGVFADEASFMEGPCGMSETLVPVARLGGGGGSGPSGAPTEAGDCPEPLSSVPSYGSLLTLQAVSSAASCSPAAAGSAGKAAPPPAPEQCPGFMEELWLGEASG